MIIRPLTIMATRPTPPVLECTFTGDSTIPMTYSVNGDTFTINNGSSVSRTLNVGDTLTITASSTAGKTFSLKGLDNFNSTVTWNHKGEGSSVSYSGIVTGAGETVIGYDSYRDKEFTAKCPWFRGGGSGCNDYQPALYVDELNTNCLSDNNWKGTVYITDVSDFTSVTQKTSNWNWGYGNRGWANYGSQASWTGWDASSVFNWDKVLNWSVTWTANIISCGLTSGYMTIYGTHKNGGTSRVLYSSTSYTYPIGQTTNYGPYTGSGSNNKGPVLCFEVGRGSGSSYNPVEHEGYCVITGVKK